MLLPVQLSLDGIFMFLAPPDKHTVSQVTKHLVSILRDHLDILMRRLDQWRLKMDPKTVLFARPQLAHINQHLQCIFLDVLEELLSKGLTQRSSSFLDLHVVTNLLLPVPLELLFILPLKVGLHLLSFEKHGLSLLLVDNSHLFELNRLVLFYHFDAGVLERLTHKDLQNGFNF